MRWRSVLPTASAQESTEGKSGLRRWAEQDYMFGDWGGLRTDLSKRGIDFEFYLCRVSARQPERRPQPGGVYQGALLMTLDVDSQKLVGYEGGTVSCQRALVEWPKALLR